MKLTNTKRAAIGFVLIAILAVYVYIRRGNQAFSQRDFMLMGAAIFLVILNVLGSYYWDVQNHKRELKKSGK
jgi:drug/metabolite transporter (DMT)-like permease